jgi:hypothetical protein
MKSTLQQAGENTKHLLDSTLIRQKPLCKTQGKYDQQSRKILTQIANKAKTTVTQLALTLQHTQTQQQQNNNRIFFFCYLF